jgi:hypothetical protein
MATPKVLFVSSRVLCDDGHRQTSEVPAIRLSHRLRIRTDKKINELPEYSELRHHCGRIAHPIV